MASTWTSQWASGGKGSLRRAALAALLYSSLATSQHTLPYVPTTVLLSPAVPGTPTNTTANSLAYIFHHTDNGVELLSVNVSATVDGLASLQTISSSLPFLDSASTTTAFLPTMADNGTIMVQAGDCAADDAYEVWSYTSGSWYKAAASLPTSADSDAGPYALGAGISFSATLAPTMSQPVLYSYGGMCLGPTTDASTWQENGTYTKSMLRVAPTDDSAGYTATFLSGKGPAFPEAGFSFTPLSPSISNRSGVVTQQNRYVLLGGHTRQAFINMSSAAIWNLPEESWNFATVGAVRSGSSELAVKSVKKRNADVESRSGHTSVLSEDGSALIIMGGWVGSVSQAASPQLAVLRMGDTYGDWTWEVPQQQPSGGIYGHGAAILPGNVMMVYGGYEIARAETTMKRQASGTGLRFLNMTSMSWTSSYSNPNLDEPRGGNKASDGSDYIKKIGLGVGLGVGLAAVLGAFLVYLCYKRHLKRKLVRDETVRSLAQDASQFLHPDDDMMRQRQDASAFPWTSHAWYTGGHDPYDIGARTLGYESLRTDRNPGSYGTYQPPGLLIPRKPIPRAARGAYQPAASLTTPGHIHPIYEADEDDSDGSKAHQRAGAPEPVTPTTPGYPDPFTTPTGSVPILVLGNRNATTPSPEALMRRNPEVQDWQSDVDAAEALLAQMPARRNTGKRSSPSRRASMRSRASMADDERTASNVSESARSAISLPTRSASHKRNSTGPVASLTLMTDARVDTSSSSSSSGHTYSTAKTTFNALQVEGPSLLHRGQKPSYETPDDDEEDFIQIPSSPSKHRPRRSLGWLGSLRRVFSGNPNESSDSSKEDDGPRRMSLDQVSSDYEPRLVGLSGIGGAELLRRKQGRQDWDVDQKSIMDEWDIEKAIEQRLVQVMFTVPKERLRVVNAEIEKEEEVVLVDPDKDELDDDDDMLNEKVGLVGYRDMMMSKGQNKGKGKGKETTEEKADEEEEDITQAFGRPESPEGQSGSPTRGRRRRLVHLPPPKDDDRVRVDVERNTSEEPRPSLTLRTAEVVSVARPKTRVLEMVESIETRSRESSPSLG